MHYQRISVAVGCATAELTPLLLGQAPHRATLLRTPPPCYGPFYRGARTGPSSLPPTASQTLPLHRGGDPTPKAVAKTLPPRNGLRGWTYYCLFGLLAVTGLRIGEALALKRQDVDLQQGLLTIREAKFAKSRLIPLQPSTQHALLQYAQRRDAYPGHGSAAHFLVSERGRPLSASTVRQTFCEISRQIGLRGPEDRNGPRLHHFRHRFAVEVLLRWYRSGEDVEQRLPVLSTFLGHARVRDTYWYLSACPELMGQAARRLEQRWRISS